MRSYKKEATWPANNVERRKVSDLEPYAANARTHSAEQVDQIAASMGEWGWTVPILIDDKGGIIAGHGRVLAAKALGIDEVPCMIAKGWTEKQKRAYVLADNKLAENAEWDTDLLKIELTGLGDEGFNLDLIGFGEMELALFLADPTGLTDPDETPDVPLVAATEAGDVWILGDHRLACGDSTTAEAVDAALGAVVPHLMVTDPPYGVEYDADWRNKAGSLGRAERAVGAVTNDAKADWSEAWALFPGDVAYVWHADVKSPEVAESISSCGFEMRALIVWAKSNLVIGRGHYHHMHEPCWYAVKKGGTGHWAGDRKQTTLWQIDKPMKSETGHSTQKPVECMKRPIENNSSPGQAVYDPFVGSGTTIIAAEMSGRICHAIELTPAYVDVAVLRWQEFTGKDATLEATGKTFEQTKRKRKKEAA